MNLLDTLTTPESANLDSKKYKDRTYLRSPVLYESNPEPEFIFLLERPLAKEHLRGLRNLIYHTGVKSYRIVSVLPFFPKDKDLSKKVVDFYREASIDLKEYVPPYSKVIAVGRGALYSIVRGDDLEVEGFRDNLLWKTDFYSPQLKCSVFPTDSFYLFYGKENFENFWFTKQVNIAKRRKVSKLRNQKIKIEVIENPSKWLLDRINGNEKVAIDLETKGLDPWSKDGHIICMTITFDGKTGYYLPFEDIDHGVLSAFLKFRPLIGTNLKFDIKWLNLHANIPLEHMKLVGDTMHLQHVINEIQRKGLKTGAWIYTTLGGYDWELDEYLRKHPKCKNDYSRIPPEVLIPYATIDPCASWQTHEKMYDYMVRLDEKYPMDNGWGLERLYNEIVIPTVNMFVDIELEGIHIDQDKLQEQSQKLEIEIQSLLKEIGEKFDIDPATLIGEDHKLEVENYFTLIDSDRNKKVNVESSSQLGHLIEKMGWTIKERGANDIPLTNDACLQRWVKEGHKEAELILKLREKTTLMKTFVGRKGEKTRGRKVGLGSGFWQYIKSDGAVHSSFAVLLAQSWRNKSKAPNCFSGDTEILTKSGWIRFDSLPKGIEVAQYHQENNSITFTKPNSYVEKKDKLLYITTKQQIEIKCTPDHRILFRNRKTGKFFVKNAENFVEDHQIIQAGEYKGEGITLPPEEIIFRCAIQADAYITPSGSFDFVFSKKRKIKRLREALNKLGMKYTLKEKGKQFRITVNITENPLLSDYHQYKTFGEWVFSLSPSSLEFLSNEVFQWDGLYERKTNYSSSVKTNIDIIQAVMVLTGKRAKVSEYVPPSGRINYQLDISHNRPFSMTTNFNSVELPTPQNTYCVTVPSDNIITRYNGKVAIIKNCQNIPSHGDKASFVRYFITPPSLDYLFLSSDYSGLQLRLASIVSNDKVMRDIFINKGGDMHSITAYNVFCRDWSIDHEDTIDKSGKVGRKLTLEDFMRLKKSNEMISETRFRAKAINFGFLFGASAFTFSKTSLEPEWSITQCKEYIHEHKLEKAYEETVKKLNSTGKNVNQFTEAENLELCYYWTVASDIRRKFFHTYVGLEKWIENTHSFAKESGYSRSIYGAFRRLPYLLYKGGDTDNSKYSGDLNISLNSPIQNMEAIVIHRAMIQIHKEKKVKGLKSKFNGQIHDAMEMLIHREEIDEFVSMVHTYGEMEYDEYKGIPFEVESNISDYEKGELWDMGTPIWPEKDP